jgi:hypothetical protein
MNKVHKAINDAADNIADVIETAGTRAQDATSGAHERSECKPDRAQPSKEAPGTVGAWTGAVACGICDLAATAVKGVGSTVGGLVAGVMQIVAGIGRADSVMMKRGLIDTASGFAGGVLLVAGKFVSLVQIVAGVERKRKLTDQEIAMLKLVFRTSVALYNVRVITGKAGIFGFNNRAFTMGNTIYMKDTAAGRWDQTLVHEATHVWQYQHLGSAYSSDALAAQLYYERVKKTSAYAWSDPTVNRGSMVWDDWNREAQAQFVEDIYANGAANGGRFTFRSTDYTALADATLLTVRKEVSSRRSLDIGE